MNTSGPTDDSSRSATGSQSREEEEPRSVGAAAFKSPFYQFADMLLSPAIKTWMWHQRRDIIWHPDACKCHPVTVGFMYRQLFTATHYSSLCADPLSCAARLRLSWNTFLAVQFAESFTGDVVSWNSLEFEMQVESERSNLWSWFRSAPFLGKF